MELSSPTFAAGQEVPVRYTCEGDDLSPPLQWHGVPDAAKSLVLIVDDPDAPDPAAPKHTWVHWVLYNLPPSSSGLPEGGRTLPGDTLAGLNDWGRHDWGGPCPPIGRHRYFFKLYALDKVLPTLSWPTKSSVVEAMHGHVLDQAELMGTYLKRR